MIQEVEDNTWYIAITRGLLVIPGFDFRYSSIVKKEREKYRDFFESGRAARVGLEVMAENFDVTDETISQVTYLLKRLLKQINNGRIRDIQVALDQICKIKVYSFRDR